MKDPIAHPSENQRAAWLQGIEALCSIFWGPDADLCDHLFRGSFFYPFEHLESVLHFTPPDALKKIKSLIGSYSDSTSLCEDLEEEYVRMFVSDKGGIPAPLYQSCHEFKNAPLMGSSAIYMTNRLEAKGLALQKHMNEPPDHLCVELEYLYFMINKGWDGNHDELIKEGSTFAAEIMLPWVTEFHKKINVKNPDSFYSLAASILIAVLRLTAGFSPAKGRVS